MKQGLNGVEGLLVDNGRHLKLNPFGWRTRPAVAGVGAVEVMFAVVGCRSKQVIDAASREATSAPGNAPFVKVRRNRLDAQRPVVLANGEPEQKPDRVGFLFVDDQDLLFAGPTPFLDLRGVAERRARTVPEALPRVFQH
ncbi:MULTISPECIES: hypothetical protein [Mesorhizobium]|uniref:Uncharacterized protein n=1 Tax=Mesorhizobium denitrificans TaxID=2294114 RepID=A0A371X8S5_9HYPH|nr:MULTISPECIES: hypothetical protein [Mesorhizobium]RFC65623.1 hypothetical protein DY251_17765 [Mesorhizobium denitrificans]